MSKVESRLYVCRTCVRDSRLPAGEPTAGERVAQALTAALQGESIVLRVVECLNGCTKPCNITLRGSGKPTVRLFEALESDAAAVVQVARRYCHSRDGHLDESEIPQSLRSRIRTHVPPSIANLRPAGPSH